ncbi:hypothetical protein QVD17_31891 [Tagetes erecta]|uniref:Uncharacterized protein n=1 Tax=Tagetes erecta TaxID=13708 RepID=A0AAD8NPR3_TARER|nr:hypothetical protein QVD17_31891 [Tagetes erecta]
MVSLIRARFWDLLKMSSQVAGFMKVGSPSFSINTGERNSVSSPLSVTHARAISGERTQRSGHALDASNTAFDRPETQGGLRISVEDETLDGVGKHAGMSEKNPHMDLNHDDDMSGYGPHRRRRASHMDNGPAKDGLGLKSQEDGLQISDPFNLGPTIDMVMRQGKNRNDIQCNSDDIQCRSLPAKEKTRESSSHKVGERKHMKKKIKLPDLNGDLYDLLRFKLSRHLLSRKKKSQKKKGFSSYNSCNSAPVLDDSRVSSVETSNEASIGVDGALSCPRLGGKAPAELDDGQSECQLSDVDLVVRREIEQEIRDTILVNSMVGLDLQNNSRQLEELIRKEGELSDFQ